MVYLTTARALFHQFIYCLDFKWLMHLCTKFSDFNFRNLENNMVKLTTVLTVNIGPDTIIHRTKDPDILWGV